MQIIRLELAGDGGVRLFTERQLDDGTALPLYIKLRGELLLDESERRPSRRGARPQALVAAEATEPAPGPNGPTSGE